MFVAICTHASTQPWYCNTYCNDIQHMYFVNSAWAGMFKIVIARNVTWLPLKAYRNEWFKDGKARARIENGPDKNKIPSCGLVFPGEIINTPVSCTKHVWYSEHGMYCRFEIILEQVMSVTHVAVIPRTRTHSDEEEFLKKWLSWRE